MDDEIFFKGVNSISKMDHEIFFMGVNSTSKDGTWNNDQGSEFNF